MGAPPQGPQGGSELPSAMKRLFLHTLLSCFRRRWCGAAQCPRRATSQGCSTTSRSCRLSAPIPCADAAPLAGGGHSRWGCWRMSNGPLTRICTFRVLSLSALIPMASTSAAMGAHQQVTGRSRGRSHRAHRPCPMGWLPRHSPWALLNSRVPRSAACSWVPAYRVPHLAPHPLWPQGGVG